jgi:Spy/CpxP family protein refolding chaperone
MKKLFAAVFAGLLALGSMSAMAAETKDTKKEDPKKVEKKTTEKKERKGGC